MKTFVALILVSLLTACGTVSGLGKDISSTADWTKEKMSGK
jgi:predicted small secreted protein